MRATSRVIKFNGVNNVVHTAFGTTMRSITIGTLRIQVEGIFTQTGEIQLIGLTHSAQLLNLLEQFQ